MSKSKRSHLGPDRRTFCRGLGAAAGGVAIGDGVGRQESAKMFIGYPPKPGEVRAVVLGSAQDGGVPHAGCRCKHCRAARTDPSLRRRSPCLAVLHGSERKVLLLDAGPDFPSQLADLPADWGEPGAPVAGLLLTHAHIGHYAGLVHLGREVMNTRGLPVYCSEAMAMFLKRNGPWSLLVELANVELRDIKPGESFSLAPQLSVEAVAVPHRAEFTDTLAYIVRGPNRKLLFLPDIDRWEDLQPPIESLLERVDIALLDGTFYAPEELPGRDMTKIPHPPVAATMDRLQSVVDRGRGKVVFIHLNHSNLLLDAGGDRLPLLRQRGFDAARDGTSFDL